MNEQEYRDALDIVDQLIDLRCSSATPDPERLAELMPRFKQIVALLEQSPILRRLGQGRDELSPSNDPSPERIRYLLGLTELGRKSLGLWDGPEATVAPSAGEAMTPGGPEYFACSKSELLRALNKDETHTKFLEQLIQAGKLELTQAEKPIGNRRYLARFSDPSEHAKVFASIEEERKRRRQ
jgi:hypothetical protein